MSCFLHLVQIAAMTSQDPFKLEPTPEETNQALFEAGGSFLPGRLLALLYRNVKLLILLPGDDGAWD